MSLRLRVALASIGATAAVVVIAGWALLALVERDERASLDNRLAREASAMAQPASLAASFLEGRVVRDAHAFDIGVVVRVTANGETVAVTEGFPALAFDVDLPGARHGAATAAYTTAIADGEEWRLRAEHIMPPAPFAGVRDDVLVEVAAPTAAIESTLAALRTRIILVGTAAVGVAGVGSWWLGGLALRPLGRIRREAERVSETRDLGVRVPVAQGPPEVDELAASFNRMLERIGDATAQTEAALEAARAFAANAAHELRTPLTSMQTNVDVLHRDAALSDAERAAIVRDLVEQQRCLLASLEALRLLARGDLRRDDVFEPVDLAEIVDAAVTRARRAFPDIVWSVTAGVDAFPLPGWADGLASLMDNLLRNAATHGRPAGTGAPEVAVTLRRDADRVHLEVADHGPGIPPADRARLVERFTRGPDAQGAGSGLGLALAAQQAALHGGTLAIDDTPGGGATVVVTLPLARGQGEVGGGVAAPEAPAHPEPDEG